MSKKILAVLLACSMLFAFAACGGNGDDETTTTTIAEETTEAIVEDTTAAVVEDTTAADTTEAIVEDSTAVDPSAEESTTAAPAAMPEGKEAIVAYFNTAVNGVKTNAKVVTRNSSKITMNGQGTYPGVVSGVLKLLGGADEFIGEQLAKNSKGKETFNGSAAIKAVFPVEGESYASKLTAADVKSATVKEENGKWVITIKTVDDGKSANVKHGQGHAPKAFNVVLPGVVNDNIPGVATSIVGTATMNYPSSTATITVDPATGNVVKAVYAMNWTINFDKAGVIIPFTTTDDFVITY